VDPVSPDPDAVEEAAARVRQGGLGVVPTRGLYGLAANAFRESAVARLFALKGRPADKPVLVLISDPSELDRLVVGVPETGRLLMDRFWPGRLTLVLPARPEVPAALTAGTGKIGVRLCGHPAARMLAAAAGGPVTGTSANRSGGPGCHRIGDLDPEVARGVDFILDAGPLAGGPGSTVVDVCGDRPEVLREGAASRAELAEVLDGVLV
jgi:L-threonylcarbamoyladenylate synthase